MSGRYKWVYHETGTLFDVGILADGTLHNPNGYPEDVVRCAVQAADARRHERHSQAATKAAVTRASRREKKITQAVKRLMAGLAALDDAKPHNNCRICGKSITDADSRLRGIGPECWQDILRMVERDRATPGATP